MLPPLNCSTHLPWYCALVRERGGGRHIPVETGQYSINAALVLRIYNWILKPIIFTFTSAVFW